MRTLFGKIFLWFFCAQVLIGGVLFVVASSQRALSIPVPAQKLLASELLWKTRTVAQLARHGSLQALDGLWEAGDGDNEEFQPQTFVFWRIPGAPLALLPQSMPLEPAWSRLAADAYRHRDQRMLRSESSWGGARYVDAGAAGDGVVLVQLPQLRHRMEAVLEDWNTTDGRVRLAILIGLMALVCYGLARHLAAPLGEVRRATQRLAAGDLSARVGFRAGDGDEVIALGQEFDAMAERLERSLAAERRLLGDVSHELRTPLARLSVALDLVEQSQARFEGQGEPVPERVYADAMKRIRREAGLLSELIGQLLELVRLEGLTRKGGEVPGMGAVRLLEVVEGVVADAQFEAGHRRCRVSLDGSTERVITGAIPLLRSAFENVVRNALRHTETGTEVRVEVRETAGGTEISVLDQGAGVPDEELEKLFRPFYRVGEGRDRQTGGVGLGLSIAERALKVHRATIAAANRPEGGLMIVMTFPREAR